MDFVVIGGIAAALHGSQRPTYDLDVAYSRAPENLERLVNALLEIGARLRVARAPAEDLPLQLDARTLAEGGNFTFTTPHGSLDVLAYAAGAPPFEKLREAAVQRRLGETTFLVASIDHLIAMKEAAGRAKDRNDALELRQISDLLRAPKEP